MQPLTQLIQIIFTIEFHPKKSSGRGTNQEVPDPISASRYFWS